MPDDALQGFVGRSPQGHFSLTPSVEIIDPSGKATPVKIAYTQADLNRPTGYANGFEKSISFGATWMSAPALLEQPATLTKRTQTAVFCFATPTAVPAGSRLVVRVKSADVGRLRFSTSPVLNPVPGQPAFSQRFLSELDRSTVLYHLCATSEAQLPAEYRTLLTELRLCRGGWTRTVTTVSVPKDKKLTTRILPRGNWQDESGPVVKPAVLSFLPQDSLPKTASSPVSISPTGSPPRKIPSPPATTSTACGNNFSAKGYLTCSTTSAAKAKPPRTPSC